MLAPIAIVAMVASAQEPQRQDSVTIRLLNTELRAAVQVMSQYLDRPLLFSGAGGPQVTIETPQPIPRRQVVRLLRGLLESQSYELVDDTAAGVYRVGPREPARPAQAPSHPTLQRPVGAPELFVISLDHARATDVAVTINALYGRSAPLADARARPPTIGDELRANALQPVGTTPPPLPRALALPGAGPAALSGEIAIVPDERVNSLLVRANRNDFDLIRVVVEQLDKPPLQVLIEALVIEVRRNRSLGIGAEARLGATTVGRGGVKIDGSVGGPGLGDFAVKVMNLGGLDLEASLRVAADRGDVRVVSRPIVLTKNNHEAAIVVGSQQPFVQLARALPTDNAVRDQVVQYKEVGTKLAVRPTISSDGSVHLDVTQEVSTATGETQFNAPVISQRSVQTQLLVRDGQTVVLGGLTDKQRTVTATGLPILSSIPLLGGLFGRGARQTTETELFVFLTPRVIRTEADAERLSAPLRHRADRVKP